MSAGQKASDAVRIGKAISKGAAAGGLRGAALGAAIEGREYVGKALAAAGVLLLLPVLFILMLPSLIFGGLTESKAADAAVPVLNDGAAVTENMTNIAYAVNQVLGEGKLAVAIMSKGHFTNNGHFIVLRGVKDGKIMVADPASRSRSEKLWDLSLIVKEASSNTAAGGPFWIIGP